MADEPAIAAIRLCVDLCRTERALVEWFDAHRQAFSAETQQFQSAAWTEVKRRAREIREETTR